MSCTHCQGQTATGITLCQRCALRLEDVLRQIPEALEVAQDTIARQDRAGGSGPTGSTPSQSAEPLNMGTMEKRRELWEAVVSNARELLEHDDSDELRGVEPVVYLQMSTDLIRRQDFAGEMLSELEAAVRKLWSAVDRRPDVIALGQCGVVHESVPCPGLLRARRGDIEARCRVCGATNNVEQLRQERAADAWEHFAPLADVVAALRQSGFTINPKSAQRWARLGELSAVRYREDSVALYSPGQVIDAHQRMKTKRGRPRKAA